MVQIITDKKIKWNICCYPASSPPPSTQYSNLEIRKRKRVQNGIQRLKIEHTNLCVVSEVK